MTEVSFLLNGTPQRVAGIAPTRTLLDWLREERGLPGTKEGCNEGDCGACTVLVTDEAGTRALNACILFVPQLHGKAVRTVEGLAGPDGTLHPVQQAMIDHHGSQCGFCTPGFVVAMAAAHAAGARDFDDRLAGNLCRCTGYAPILRAAEAAAGEPVPDWMTEDLSAVSDAGEIADGDAFRPRSADALAAWYRDHPEATLVAGATDVGLWVTKALRELGEVAFLNGCDDLRRIEAGEEGLRIGAAVPWEALRPVMARRHPDFAELIRRFGSVQVRGAATVGGNIANGSPIADGPPALIALGARLTLRRGDARREIALEDFFLDYGKQDRAPGEFVESVTVPEQADALSCYKLSKRFDQDISAVCGCFNIRVEDGIVQSARIAFGGMAATPKRAAGTEAALAGKRWCAEVVEAAAGALAGDFTPIDDMRASAGYRVEAAQGMLRRCHDETSGARRRVLEVAP